MVGAQRALLESVASPSVRRFRGGSAWPRAETGRAQYGNRPIAAAMLFEVFSARQLLITIHHGR
jgi:hypothetical protein